jgi:hypothetical protein
VCRFEFFDHFDLGTIDDFDHKDFVDLFPADHAIRFQYEIVYGASIAHASGVKVIGKASWLGLVFLWK